MIGERKIDIPSYTVTVEEESNIHFTPESKIPQMLEANKAKEPKVVTPAEGEEGAEATTTPAEATTTPAEATTTPAEATTTPAEATKEDKPLTN
jgi:small subunit ribosomal protein S4